MVSKINKTSDEIWDEFSKTVKRIYDKHPKMGLCYTGEVSRKGWQGIQIHWRDKRQTHGSSSEFA